MTYLEVRTRVGPDGILNFTAPIGLSAANREVKITVEGDERRSHRPQ